MATNEVLVVDIDKNQSVVRALSSELRIKILALLSRGSKNINELRDLTGVPQSTVSTNVSVLEEAGMVITQSRKGKKGRQKVCTLRYEEMIIRFSPIPEITEDNTIEVEMPIGLYTNFEVSSPCGLCSPEGIIGYLDVPGTFYEPERIKAGLLWFEKGFVEYKFPNNSLYEERPLESLEISAELSSETPGTNKSWTSDITVWVNGVEIGYWTAPGDFGDVRGRFTPSWWKLEGSQYGLRKRWVTTRQGSFVDGVKVSDVTLDDLDLPKHHSIVVRIGVKEDAARPGGINIFGRGFGNYDQDVTLRLSF